MDDTEPLKTLADLPARLNLASPKSARRSLERAMANDPGLRVTMRGRTVLFTPEQFARTIKALDWRPNVPTRAARTVTVVRTGRSARSAQNAVLELTRKASPAPKWRGG